MGLIPSTSTDENFKKLSDYALINYGQLLKEDNKAISFKKISDSNLGKKDIMALRNIRHIMGVKKANLATKSGIIMTYSQIAEFFNFDGRIFAAKINLKLPNTLTL